MKKVRKLFRSRLIHFVLIGFAIFAVDRFAMRYLKKIERGEINISAEKVESLRSDFIRQSGHQPSEVQLKALIRDAIDEEILVREARRLLLDKGDETVRLRLLSKMRSLGEGEKYSSSEELYRKAYEMKLDEDTVIRRHLVHKMQILLARSVNLELPTDKEIEAYIKQNPEQFEPARKTTFSHVFIRSKSSKKINELLDQLRSSPKSMEMTDSVSDPFPLGLHFTGMTESLLKRRFGKEFANKIFATLPGEWVGPIESPFGIHLIRVESNNLPNAPTLADLRPVVARSLTKERTAGQVEESMDQLRKLYSTKIDWNIKRAANASL